MTLRRRGAVVYGPYPPFPGPASAATLGDVRRLLADGATVRVVSPAPSAAHDDADLRRPLGTLRFVRRGIGADRLVLHLDAELLTSKAHREELPARLAVAAALRSARHSTVRVPAAVSVLPAWSRALGAADEVVVGEEQTTGGAMAAALRPEPGPAWELPPEPTKDEIEAQIHRRAAERRAARRAVVAAEAGQGGASRALRAMPLLGPEPPRSARLAADVVKRVVSRLIDWRINPVIEHVNLLHRAVHDAVDPDREAGEVGDG